MGAGSQPRLVRFDAFTLDLSRCVLLCRGVEVSLRRQAFDMLLYLAERPGERHRCSRNSRRLYESLPNSQTGRQSRKPETARRRLASAAARAPTAHTALVFWRVALRRVGAVCTAGVAFANTAPMAGVPDRPYCQV